jgi:hypothetical protein
MGIVTAVSPQRLLFSGKMQIPKYYLVTLFKNREQSFTPIRSGNIPQ